MLKWLHKIGIVHRDIKLSKIIPLLIIHKGNILLGSKRDFRKIKIIDFGISSKI